MKNPIREIAIRRRTNRIIKEHPEVMKEYEEKIDQAGDECCKVIGQLAEKAKSFSPQISNEDAEKILHETAYAIMLFNQRASDARKEAVSKFIRIDIQDQNSNT